MHICSLVLNIFSNIGGVSVMLRGSAKVQLFNAETKELEKTVESSNLITNAISNIFNGALTAFAACYNNGRGASLNYLYDFPSEYNLARALMGGLLIFSDRIEENINHIIPSVSEMRSFIGCANQGGSIEGNIFKGSLSEIKRSEDGKSIAFVWEFSKEQCNGKIGCLCLTSDRGGQLGFKFNTLSDITGGSVLSCLQSGMWNASSWASFNYSYPHYAMFKSPYTSQNPHGSFIADTEYKYVYRDTVYATNIEKLLSEQRVGLELKDNFAYGNNKSYDRKYSLKSYSYDIFKCTDADKVYEIDRNMHGIILDKENNLYLYSDYDQFDYYVKTSDGVKSKTHYYVTGLKFWLIRVDSDDVVFDITNLLISIYNYHGVAYERERTFNAVDSNGDPTTHNYTEFTASDVLIEFRDHAVIHNDKIYFLTGSIGKSENKLRMYVVSFDGSFTYKDIKCTDVLVNMLFGTTTEGGSPLSHMNVTFTKFFDNLVLVSKDSTNGYKCFFVDANGSIDDYPFTVFNNNISLYGYDLYKNDLWLKEPWCSFKVAGNGYFNTIELWSTYLATINNQEYDLVKTSDQTMKITYTLTQS